MKLNLYSDMADGVISKEEYMEFRAGYDRKIQARQQSLVQLKEEREQALESTQRSVTWIELFKQYENITELQRSVIVNLIERIIIYDSKHIEVVFRYEDQLHSAMQYVERISEIIEEVV